MIRVTIADGRGDLYQWDIDRILQVEGAPDGSVVYFIDKDTVKPDGVELKNGQVLVPNKLLQDPRLFLKLYVWNDGYTLGSARIRVIAQPKPSGYMYTETEIMTWEKLYAECGYYTPTVAEDGTLSWTPNKNTLPNLPSTNIKGPKGDDAKVSIKRWTADDV